jgi:hypothetical protein
MAGIKVDPHGLPAIGRRIETALTVGEEIRASHSALRSSALAAGRADVSEAIGSFLDAWSYGISCIDADARSLARLLCLSSESYDQTETSIARAAGL